MAQNGGFVAVRTRRNNVDRRADQLFDAFDVSTGVSWQLFQGFGTHGRLGPARHLFVHRLQAHVAVSISRGNGVALRIFVADADVDGFQTVEHVQLGQADARDAVHIDSATQDNSVEPTTTPSTAGSRAELVTLFSQVRTDFVEQLSREWTRTYTRGVSLGNAQDVVQEHRANTRTGSYAASGGVRAGHVRVGTVVDVQQGALGAFEHDVFASATQVVQLGSQVQHQRLEQLRVLFAFGQGLVEVDGRLFVVTHQHEVVVFHQFTQFVFKTRHVEQIAHAQATACNLVFVSRADAATGGADLQLATGLFTGLVQRNVEGQDQWAGRADTQALAHRYAFFFQLGDLAQQGVRCNHHAVADQALHAFAQYARRDQVQDSFFTVDHQGVTGVVATLVAHYGGSMFGQQINDLAFALITPLGAQDYDILTHNTCPHSRKLGAGGSRQENSRSQWRYLPKPVLLNQLPVAVRFTGGGQRLPRQCLDNTLTLTAQLANLLPECRIRTVRHPDTARR